jgi:hypothetical protein
MLTVRAKGRVDALLFVREHRLRPLARRTLEENHRSAGKKYHPHSVTDPHTQRCSLLHGR